MWHPIAVDLTDAVAADELWGWPVELLDRLRELRVRATNGSLSLDEWREQDASLRAGHPAVDMQEVLQFQDDFIVNTWLKDKNELNDQLLDRLGSLTGAPPSDEELWEELKSAQEALTAPRKQDSRMVRVYQAQRDRIIGWLTRPGGGIDPVTGLAWSQIERYRIVNDPVLGPVPQYIHSARQHGLRDASPEDQDRAELIRATIEPRHFAAILGDLNQHQLTWLPKLLAAEAERDETMRPLLADLLRVWSDPRTQQILVQETSREWPADRGI
jgi:hypothetical protein